MRKGKNKICGICGKTIKPGGIGGHLRLAHAVSDVREVRGEVRDVRGDVPEVSGDAREEQQGDYTKHREIIERYKEPSAANQEPDYLLEANLLQKQFRLIHSIKAPNENRLDEMMRDYVLNNNSSDCYLQKHMVLENYWCCWVWERRIDADYSDIFPSMFTKVTRDVSLS